MAREIRRLTAEIVIEAEPEELPKMTNWVVSRLKSSVDFSDHGAIAIALFDEQGVMVGQNQVGQFGTLDPAQLQALFQEAG